MLVVGVVESRLVEAGGERHKDQGRQEEDGRAASYYIRVRSGDIW